MKQAVVDAATGKVVISDMPQAQVDALTAEWAMPVPPKPLLSQDLMAQFTADDAAKIQAAVNGNAQFWLLWSAMQAQSDPMIVTNDRFLQGWSALTQVLGADRMATIAKALGVTVDG